MSCGVTLCFFKPILAVAAVAAVGMAGFNFATTGCPLGRCETEQAANVAAVAAKSAPSACCPESAGAPEGVLLASAPAADASSPHGACPAMDADHCSDAMKAACEATGQCPVTGEDCSGTDAAACEAACETQCPHEAPAGQVAGGDTSVQPAGGEG